MVTDRTPVCPAPAKAPLSATATLTVRALVGAGLALSVKVAGLPSVTAAPAVTRTTGPAGGAPSRQASAAAKRRQPRVRAEAAVIGAIGRWSAVQSAGLRTPNATSTLNQFSA